MRTDGIISIKISFLVPTFESESRSSELQHSRSSWDSFLTISVIRRRVWPNGLLMVSGLF